MQKLFCLLALIVFSITATAQFKKLVWADEFNYSGLPDSNKWGYETGNSGWGNNELQFYTGRRMNNGHVGKGLLTINAVKESFQGAAYTSARLISKDKGNWKYGRIEVRAKVPGGRGVWPAIWMMATDQAYGGWPKSGEIDIMENVGYNPDSVFATVHTESYNHIIGTQKTKGLLITNLSIAFHVYAVEWSENKIEIFIDKIKYFHFDNEGTGYKAWPFDKQFHLLLNIAVGGGWGGKMGVDDSIFPQEMQVDYVRVYQ
ncbi:MAG: glycoside hydrolase family 16 protein [Chitinophagaceae bacterium]